MDKEGDDEIFQKSFEEFQARIQGDKESEKLKEKMRQELSQYVESSLRKVGTDGHTIISVPDNFDTVVNAMSRNDLFNTDAKPWSQVLLQAKFDSDMASQHGNRYVSKETEAARVERGLAEIHLLDSQLFSITKRALELRAFSAKDEIDTERASDNGSRSSSPRSQLFQLTRLSRGNSEHIATQEEFDATASEEVDMPPQQSDPKTDVVRTATKKNFIKENAAAVKTRRRLSVEEENRLQQILEDEDEKAVHFSNACYERLHQIDVELERYSGGSLAADNASRLGQDISMLSMNTTDTLVEQRRLRAVRQYEAEIDRKLKLLKSNDLDLSGLVEESDVQLSMEKSEISSMERITMTDVKKIISECTSDASRASLDVSEHKTSELTVNRREIDKLLGDLRPQIDALTSLRTKGIASDASTPAGRFSPQRMSFTDWQPLSYEGSDEEDEPLFFSNLEVEKTPAIQPPHSSTLPSIISPRPRDSDATKLGAAPIVNTAEEILRLPPVPGATSMQKFDSKFSKSRDFGTLLANRFSGPAEESLTKERESEIQRKIREIQAKMDHMLSTASGLEMGEEL